MKLYAFTAHVDLITALFHSPQIEFAHLRLPNYSEFHCILTRCRGPRHSPLDMAFPFNSTACDRVGVYLPLERKWISIAIIKSLQIGHRSRYKS